LYIGNIQKDVIGEWSEYV